MLVPVLIAVGVILAAVAVFAAMRSREASDAVNTLSRETRKSDRCQNEVPGPAVRADTGLAVHAASCAVGIDLVAC